MIIRRAQEQDIPDIHKLLGQVEMVHHVGRPDLFKYKAVKYNDEELAELIKDDSRPIFVCVDEARADDAEAMGTEGAGGIGTGAVLGYAFCIFQQYLENNVMTDIKTLYIDDLCVDEELRGQHIGRRLYEYVVEFAKKEGCYNVTLNVWSLNESAMKFYESCGLTPYKVCMEKLLQGRKPAADE